MGKAENCSRGAQKFRELIAKAGARVAMWRFSFNNLNPILCPCLSSPRRDHVLKTPIIVLPQAGHCCSGGVNHISPLGLVKKADQVSRAATTTRTTVSVQQRVEGDRNTCGE